MNGRALRRRIPAMPGGAMRAARAGALLLALAAAVAACETAPPPERVPLSFAHLPPLVFELGRIEVVEPAAEPHPADIDHLLPIPPAVAARLWVDERLRADGAAGLLRVTIDEASARGTRLETDAALEDLFTLEQSELVETRLRVTVEAIDGTGSVRGHAIADARRSRTIPEGITLAERERIYDEIVSALMQDFDASQEQAIRQYLHLYLR